MDRTGYLGPNGSLVEAMDTAIGDGGDRGEGRLSEQSYDGPGGFTLTLEVLCSFKSSLTW